MFKTVDEGLERYKEESQEYLKWLQDLEKKYNTPISKMLPMYHFDHDDLGKIEKWSAKLRGMQEALGLTIEDDKIIIDKIKKELDIPVV